MKLNMWTYNPREMKATYAYANQSQNTDDRIHIAAMFR